MKKKTLKKLQLRKETLNNLSEHSKQQVIGGADAIDADASDTVQLTIYVATRLMSCVTCKFTQCNQNTCAITCFSVCDACPITNHNTALNCCIA